MKKLALLLALQLAVGCYVIKDNSVDGSYEYKCACFESNRECLYPQCDEDKSRCKDEAQALNEAHERRMQGKPCLKHMKPGDSCIVWMADKDEIKKYLKKFHGQ